MFEGLTYSLSVFVVLASLVNQGTSCKKQMPPFGPRLLRAKALFGNFMRDCKAELLDVAKAVPPQKVHEMAEMACRIYNACKPSVIETPPDVMYDCAYSVTQNVSHFTYFGMPDQFQHIAKNYLACAQNSMKKYSVPLQTIDDVITVAYVAVHTFGWT
ncbi:uncharacterized protein LOC142768636 [Rhipicephalus microplus]|uniref:uncharacterized protein LOC142768636 n=1 Tax=Rhipicephalus microplus TaxID=6941 RepID=UPI003F6B77B2